MCAQRRLRSARASDAQADLSLCWAQGHFVGFVITRLISYRWDDHRARNHTGQCLRRIAGGNVGLPLDTT